jgi:hypothetical protein
MAVIPPGTTVVPENVLFDQRVLFVMDLLLNQHNFPVNGAIGLVGNLILESGVLPNRIEGSGSTTPMRSGNFENTQTTFTPEEVMNRNKALRVGPSLPGIGLAQWTSERRRHGLFQHEFMGVSLGAAILFNIEAQVDYLMHELETDFRGVHDLITNPSVSVNDASDEVVYRFEVPGSVIGGVPRGLLPRDHPNVQREFARRRHKSEQALQIFNDAHH